MILAPHALAGAATAVILRKHPLVAVAAAFLSHFILDAIPHWHYRLSSVIHDSEAPFGERFIFDKRFLKDVLKTGFDFGAGLTIALGISYAFFPSYFWLTLFGAAAGVLPDFLQLMYHLFPDSPLLRLQRFHKWIHAEKNLDEFPFIGIASQAIVGVILTVMLKLLGS